MEPTFKFIGKVIYSDIALIVSLCNGKVKEVVPVLNYISTAP
jgi:hypothetical protein